MRFFYRPLTRKELKSLVALNGNDEASFEEAVCKLCVLAEPPEFPGYDLCLAGLPTTLCSYIMEASGYLDDGDALLREAISWVNTRTGRMDSLICFSYPLTKLDDLDDMAPTTYYKYAAAAALVATTFYPGFDIDAFLDPQAPPKKNMPIPTGEDIPDKAWQRPNTNYRI